MDHRKQGASPFPGGNKGDAPATHAAKDGVAAKRSVLARSASSSHSKFHALWRSTSFRH